MEQPIRHALCEGVHFTAANDARFKTLTASAFFVLPLGHDTVAANALLPFVLTHASREFPDYTRLGEYLQQLYGASLGCEILKLGNMQVLAFSVNGISDKYTHGGERLSEKLADLLCSVLFTPLCDEDGLFPLESFLQEKRQTLEAIDTEFNNKRSYARRQCLRAMCREEAFGIDRYGSHDEVERVTREELILAWKRMITTARIELMAFGDCDIKAVRQIFSEKLSAAGRCFQEEALSVPVRIVQQVQEIGETNDVTQTKLVMGFRTGITRPYEDMYLMEVMNAMLGGSATSKLFLNVREKLGLCYYCSSGCDAILGILFIDCGVEQENVSRAKEEILKQITELQKGNFTEEELSDAKKGLCTALSSGEDSISSTEAWYIARIFLETPDTPEIARACIEAVTREEVIRAANRITLDTVYVLSGGDGK